MSRIGNYERKIKKHQRNIEKQQKKIEELSDRLYQKKISEESYLKKTQRINQHIREENSEIRILQGIIVKVKHTMQENN
jgi:predicted  nucleic acid-binding Zn-ribbon protein